MSFLGRFDGSLYISSKSGIASLSSLLALRPVAVTRRRSFRQFISAHLLGRYLADLKERGWTRSEMGQLKIWPMAEDLAMVVADGTRYKADGSRVEPVRACYTVRRDANNWKIVTISEVAPPFLGPGDLPR